MTAEYLCVALTLAAGLVAFILMLFGLEFLAIHSRRFRRFLRWLWRVMDI